MNYLLTRSLSVVSLFFLSFGSSSVHAAPRFYGVGQSAGIGSPSNPVSLVDDVSANGRVVVGQIRTVSGIESYRWTEADGMQFLGDLPGGPIHSHPYATSNDGTVVVGAGTTSSIAGFTDIEGYQWTQATGMIALGHLDDSLHLPFSYGIDVSGDGQLVVGWSREAAIGNEPFLWTPSGGMRGLGFNGVSTGISDDGRIVIGNVDPGSISTNFNAYRWTESTGVQVIGPLPGGTQSHAAAISGDGNVIAGDGNSPSGSRAFSWTISGGMQVLPQAMGIYHSFSPTALTFDGSLMTGQMNKATSNPFPTDYAATVWDSIHGIRLLSDFLRTEYALQIPTGWLLTNAHVSADGKTFAGSAINPLGKNEAWVAIVPEPSGIVIASVSGAMLLAFRARRRNHRRV